MFVNKNYIKRSISASMISDYDGNEYQRIEYTPYGETWVEKTQNTGLEFLPYKFTGKELDEETGLYYYGARYLDPKYSMWISTDPALGEYIPAAGKATTDEASKLPGVGGLFNHVNHNLYHYAGNNPVRYTDPDGKTATVAFTVVGAITGGVSALIQGKELGSKECWGGVAGGAASGFAVGLATDLTVATGGAAAAIIVGAGAVGGAAGSSIESKVSGEKIDPLNVITDGIIGAVSAGVGNVVGNKLAKVFTENSDKIIKACATEGADKTLGLMTDLTQDIINPSLGKNDE